MPRDEWRKATLRAKYGPVGYETGRKQKRKHKRKHKRRTRAERRAAAKAASKVTPNGWNRNSKLWFGQHANKAIYQIPNSYLGWLLDNLTPGESWRIDGLLAFLRVYLQPSNGKGVTGDAPAG